VKAIGDAGRALLVCRLIWKMFRVRAGHWKDGSGTGVPGREGWSLCECETRAEKCFAELEG
jgi:hypothetical protein